MTTRRVSRARRGLRLFSRAELRRLLGESSHSTTLYITGELPPPPPPPPAPPPDDPPSPDPGDPGPPGNPPSDAGGGEGGAPPPPPPPACTPRMPTGLRIQQSVLELHEGGNKRTTYVLPPSSFPKSGVTVGIGVDLSRHMNSTLAAWGVRAEIRSALQPFLATAPGVFGPSGSAAQSAMARYGAMTLAQSDLDVLNKGAMNDVANAVGRNYDTSPNNIIRMQFLQMPAALQTVLVDVAYRHGPNLASSAPNFWAAFSSNDFLAAKSELLNWYGPGKTEQRYMDLAGLIQGVIDIQSAPDGGETFCP